MTENEDERDDEKITVAALLGLRIFVAIIILQLLVAIIFYLVEGVG